MTQEDMNKTGTLVLIVIMALSFCMSIGAETLTGARGFSHRFFNRSYVSWLIVNLGNDSPNMNCHVSYLKDGAWWSRWGAAQVDTSGLGDWIELSVCMYVDGFPRIRVNARSRITLTDPPETPYYLPTGGGTDSCDCTSEIEPGTQVWTTGPEDTDVDWPPPGLRWPGGIIWPDTFISPPLPQWEYVVDREETTGVVRVTNYPLAEGPVYVTTLPDSFIYPLLPGESRRFMPDGTLGEPGNVLVYPARDTFLYQDETVEIDFELWNLSSEPLTFANEAEDTDGWPLVVSDPIVTVPPTSFIIVTVTATAENPGMPSNMVTLQATDTSDASQTHWAASFIDVLLNPTDAGGQVPATAWLGQCRPNPFNPTTEIPFKLSAQSKIRIDVYDVSGRFVATIAEGPYSAGWHTATWNGKNLNGHDVESGVYFYRLELEDGKSMVKKMVLLR